MSVIRVLVAESHPPTRLGIRIALQDAGMAVVAEAATGDEALQAAIKERPALCVLDLHMPGGGVATIRSIANAVPEADIVVLASSEDANDLLTAVRAGADGYLLKSIDPERLAAALHAVARGEAALPRALMRTIIQDYRRRDGRRTFLVRGRRVELSDRELEISDLLSKGLVTGEVASHLAISDVTVRRHISAVAAKLGVVDREAALRLLKKTNGGSW